MKKNESLTISVHRTMSDCLHAYQVHYAHLPSARLKKMAAVFVLGMGLYGVYLNQADRYAIILIILAPVIWFDLIQYVTAFFWLRRHPKVMEPVEVSANSTGMRFKSATSESKVKWDAYNRYLEDKSVFLLYRSKRMFLILPKRFFTGEQLATFRDILSQKVKRGK